VVVGGSASFTVTATGSAPLSYQWSKDGSAINGATSATYTINGVASANAGSYSVLVSNSAGSVTSASATLTVTTAGERADDRNAARINVSGDRWHGEFLGECKWHGASELPVAEGWYGD
jgi:hypothetical protein